MAFDVPIELTDRLVYFDLETSGLDPNRHEIIQFAATNPSTGLQCECKIRFDVEKADPQALAHNHYDRQVWASEAVSRETALHKIVQFLRIHNWWQKTSRKGTGYRVARLCAYNGLAFDGPFLRRFFQDEGVFLPADPKIWDPYPLAMWLFPALEHHRLADVAGVLGLRVARDDLHDALEDTKLLWRVTEMLTNGLHYREDDAESAASSGDGGSEAKPAETNTNRETETR